MSHLSLCNSWKLIDRPFSDGLFALPEILRQKEGWLSCDLPCDVRMPLIDAGKVKDPVLADYCFDSEWVEYRSWWFVREFNSSDLDLDANVIELVLESIDAYGDIFINGSHIGHIENAYHPFAADIKPYIIEGTNILAVRVTTGLEQVNENDLSEIQMAMGKRGDREDYRRCVLRKPAYTVGWDWAPRIVTCGITKSAYINCYRGVVVRDVKLETMADHSTVKIEIESESFDFAGTCDADYFITIKKDGEVKVHRHIQDVLTTSGINFIDAEVTIPDAELWWPNGYGTQPLYDIEISVTSKSTTNAYPSFKYGLRTISLDKSRIDESSRMFALVINGVRIFCKGANWIPADSIYARVTDEKYRHLVGESKNANFNMLRVWGGGLYESDSFYNACDELGILVWQDFTFACAPLPDHLEKYQNSVAREMDYQTKRLRNHASLALWCGNNENHWGYGDILSHIYQMTRDKQYGLYTGNVLAVQAVRKNCPHIPYWNSSPYGGKVPNDKNVGNVHHWHECMMNADMEKRIEPFEFDKVEAKFVSEYGFPGPCPLESIKEYHDGQTPVRGGDVWNLHNNTFEKHTVAAGIKKHYTDSDLSIDDYILYAGMVQSEMLCYSLESFRFKSHCSGGLFWMYNDAWGEVGWSIIDYYLRRKISFYGAKRAFEPVKVIIRETDGLATAVGCNDTPYDITFAAKAGYISFDGVMDKTSLVDIVIPKHSRVTLYNTLLPDEDYKNGVFAIMPVNDVSPAYLRVCDRRELNLPAPDVRVISSRKEGNDTVVELTSPVFVHGVHIKAANCSDNYFDLLPGQVKKIYVYNIIPDNIEFFTVL